MMVIERMSQSVFYVYPEKHFYIDTPGILGFYSLIFNMDTWQECQTFNQVSMFVDFKILEAKEKPCSI